MWLVVLKSSWKQNFILMTRYLFNMVSGVVTMYIVFLMLFFGAKAVGANTLNLGNTLEGLFTGYVVWMMVLIGYQDLAYSVTNQAQTGTLEQLYLSPVGYKWIAFFAQSFNSLMSLVWVIIVVALMVLTTGQKLNLDLVSIIPVFLAIYIQATGLGFALAGLALVYKRIQAFFQVVTFGVVALFFIPWSKFPWAKYLPFTMGRYLLQKIMINGLKLWHLGWPDISALLAATVLYLGFGVFCFCVAESKAKNKGLLGQY